MSRKADEGRKDLKMVEDARAKARRKVTSILPFALRGKIVCHLDGHPLNNDLRNLAIMPRSSHSRLQALLKHYKIPKGRIAKKFAMTLRSMGKIEMVYPIKRTMKGVSCEVKKKIQGFIM